jgi:transposase-like protein
MSGSAVSGLTCTESVDSAGDTIDFLLSPKRDLTAAKLFLRLALSGTSGVRPRVINVDGHPAYARAIAELKQSGDLGRRCRCRPSPYLNNVIEQDHRFFGSERESEKRMISRRFPQDEEFGFQGGHSLGFQ